VIDIGSINAEFVIWFWLIIHFSGAKGRICQESMASVRIPTKAFEKLGNPAADQAQEPFLNPVICRKGQV
jgi:hypothetical protein